MTRASSLITLMAPRFSRRVCPNLKTKLLDDVDNKTKDTQDSWSPDDVACVQKLLGESSLSSMLLDFEQGEAAFDTKLLMWADEPSLDKPCRLKRYDDTENVIRSMASAQNLDWILCIRTESIKVTSPVAPNACSLCIKYGDRLNKIKQTSKPMHGAKNEGITGDVMVYKGVPLCLVAWQSTFTPQICFFLKKPGTLGGMFAHAECEMAPDAPLQHGRDERRKLVLRSPRAGREIGTISILLELVRIPKSAEIEEKVTAMQSSQEWTI